MAKTLARTFYASDVDHDGAWGTDVRAMVAAVPGTLANSQNNHGTTATTNTITYDPFTISTTTGDRGTNFGWAINALAASAEGMGSAVDARRVIPAGDWTFAATVNIPAGGTATGSLTVYLTFKVYRVSAAGARTFLFSSQSGSASSSALAAANNELLTSTKADQPEFILEPGETLHLAIDSTCQQTAGLLGATVQGSIVMQHTGTAAPRMVVPAPGIRTHYQDRSTVTARGAGVLRTLVRKTHLAGVNGGGTFVRTWDAFRVMEGVGVAAALHGKLIIQKPMEATAAVRAVDGLTIVMKKALRLQVVGVGTRSTLVRKANLETQAKGVGVMSRLWDAVRAWDATAVGVPADLRRVVIFVRTMEGVAVGRLKARIGLDWDDLPASDGSGGTTVVRRPVYIFDD